MGIESYGETDIWRVANPEVKNWSAVLFSNLRRQLELLYREYNLSVNQDATVFTATVKINLASHV